MRGCCVCVWGGVIEGRACERAATALAAARARHELLVLLPLPSATHLQADALEGKDLAVGGHDLVDL